jgi:hypothetical protein
MTPISIARPETICLKENSVGNPLHERFVEQDDSRSGGYGVG